MHGAPTGVLTNPKKFDLHKNLNLANNLGIFGLFSCDSSSIGHNVGLSVGLSVCLSVGLSVGPSVRNEFYGSVMLLIVYKCCCCYCSLYCLNILLLYFTFLAAIAAL